MTRGPSTASGRAAGGLLAGTVLLFLVLQLMRVAGQGPGEDFSDNIAWSICVSLFFLAGIAALGAGAWALIKSRERAVAVYAATIVGLLVTALLVVELTTTH